MLLIDVMEHRVAVQSEEFARRVMKFVMVAAMDIGWMDRHKFATWKHSLFFHSPLWEALYYCIHGLAIEGIDEKTVNGELSRSMKEVWEIKPQDITLLISFIIDV